MKCELGLIGSTQVEKRGTGFSKVWERDDGTKRQKWQSKNHLLAKWSKPEGLE